ncbi:hypothetical protein, partial [Klebsiella pneumoniae]|uniref:hypothetical protein n=1 Tax=Klebsiella pneumoniae TaxID=573 RepID=UPI004055366F
MTTTKRYSPVEIVFGLRGRPRHFPDTSVDTEITAHVINHELELHKRWDAVRTKITKEKRKRIVRDNLKVRDVM